MCAKLFPFWQDVGEFVEDYGEKIGFELHGGFSVHTPFTLLKLREATSPAIGANLDPSHLWWQGIDPVAAIKIVGKGNTIHYNMHALTYMQPYGDVQSCTFPSVGCGIVFKSGRI